MLRVRKANDFTLTGWSAAGALVTIALTKVLTAPFNVLSACMAGQSCLWHQRHPGHLWYGPLQLLALRGPFRDLARGPAPDQILRSCANEDGRRSINDHKAEEPETADAAAPHAGMQTLRTLRRKPSRSNDILLFRRMALPVLHGALAATSQAPHLPERRQRH